MRHKHLVVGILIVVVLAGAPALVSVGAPARQSGNLLRNPGFEGLSCPGLVPPDACLPGHNFTHDVHIQDGVLRDNLETPEGWVSWWREQPPDWNQPEVVLMPSSNPTYVGNPLRIYEGNYAVKAFGPHGRFEGGFYQVVTGLTPGETVQFSAHGHTWSCETMDGDNGYATTCGDVHAMPMYVGIEPNGLADPFASSIIWSQPYYRLDAYGVVGPLTAQVGASGTVVVYLRTTGKWHTMHNDAYWDDTALVYTSAQPAAPTATAQPGEATSSAEPTSASTPGPTPTPFPTSTPRPDGATVHIVVEGDTLLQIALDYGVEVDQIRQLNAGTIGEGDLISVGQELVIAAGSLPTSQTPQATPAAVSAAAPTATLPAPPVAPIAAYVCASVFHDRNGDGVRDPALEELLPGAGLRLAEGAAVLAEYTSDGVNEPYCFEVAPGMYRVLLTPPPGYGPSGPIEAQAAVAAAATMPLEFGAVALSVADGPTTTPLDAPAGVDATPQGDEDAGSGRSSFVLPLILGGGLLLVGAGVAVVLVVVRRRV